MVGFGDVFIAAFLVVCWRGVDFVVVVQRGNVEGVWVMVWMWLFLDLVYVGLG